MRFRLATSGTGGGGQELAGGIGNLFRSMAMAPAMAAQAQQEAQDAQAQRALRGAQMRAADASAGFDLARTADLNMQQERGSIGSLMANAARIHNVAPDQQPDLVSYLQTGQMPGQYTPAPDGMGPVLPTPAVFTDGTAQKVGRTAGLSSLALAQGDKSVENLFKALGLQRGMDLGDDVLAGRRSAADVGQAQAAMEGKKLVDAIGNTGMGYNLFSGQGQQLEPGLRAIFGDQAAAEIKARNAQANASNASAANSYASRDKTRQETDLLKGNAVIDGGGPSQAGLTKQYGKAPPGYRWKADGTAEAIPGGPADIKAGEVGAKAQARADAAALAANNVLTAVKDAKNMVSWNTAGAGSVLANIPGFDARDLRAKLDTIKANLGFDRLQQMREMSPTGGALGAVAVQELIALQSTVASLDQGQSTDELRSSLDKIEQHYNRWLEAVNSQAPRAPAAPGPAPGAPQPGTVEDGFQFIGGNPSDPKNWRKVP